MKGDGEETVACWHCSLPGRCQFLSQVSEPQQCINMLATYHGCLLADNVAGKERHEHKLCKPSVQSVISLLSAYMKHEPTISPSAKQIMIVINRRLWTGSRLSLCVAAVRYSASAGLNTSRPYIDHRVGLCYTMYYIELYYNSGTLYSGLNKVSDAISFPSRLFN